MRPLERSDTSLSMQSGGSASVRESRLYGSRTSISALPSLPSPSETPKHGIPSDVEPTDHTEDFEPPTPETSYVEFDFSGHAKDDSNAFSERVISHRTQSQEDIEPPPAPDQVQLEPVDDDFFSSSSQNWKSMKTITELDYYDERGELEFKSSSNRFDSLDNRAGSRGYTKIDTEEQVTKYAELDKKTDFLFNTSPEKPSYDSDEDDEGEDDEDSEKKLETTKNMLTESQKFGYIGIAKLVSVEMATELAKIKLSTSRKVAKTMSFGQRNFSNWTMYVMTKLYDHLDLTEEEKKMIENLSVHGVEVSDLSSSFVDAALNDASNPMAQYIAEKYPGYSLKWVLVCDLFMVLLSDGYYDSRSNTLLVEFATRLGITNVEILQFQRRLLESLEFATNEKSIENKDELLNDRSFIEKHIKKNRKKKLAYIGLATLGGSLAIGLSAGLLAPVIGAGIAAGLTTVGIAGTGGFLAGVGGSVLITTGGVVAGVRVGNRAASRRLGDVQTFELKPLHNNKRPNLIITISGWMNGKLDDVRLPFSTVDPVMGDMFSLLWEPEMLQSMGQTINILATEALTTSIQQILGATILTALMSAIQLPMALSKLSYLLDNPWNVSLDRAWKAGKILADTLISGNMGVRPITLVGFSLGSRLLYSCLIELAKRGGYGLIENVIILGTPIAVKVDQMALARSVVSGRFINGYSKKDWILGYLFRATGGGISSVAGLSPIEKVYGVENIDCTDLVEGHMSYRQAIPKILKRMDWEVLSEEFAEIEEPDPEQGERTRQLIHEFDEARAKMKQEMEQESEKKKTWKDWFKPKQKDWWDVASKDQPTPAGPANETSNDGTLEYDENSERTDLPIFDVSALMSEINDIEHLAEEGEDVLSRVRGEVDTSEKVLTTNEDQEDAEEKGGLSSLIPGNK